MGKKLRTCSLCGETRSVSLSNRAQRCWSCAAKERVRLHPPKKGPRNPDRDGQIRTMRERGATLEEIGLEFGITRQRVHSILGIGTVARGRPRKPDIEAKRHAIGFRTTLDLKLRIEAAAAESRRSVAQEIELRLERSFDADLIRNAVREAMCISVDQGREK